MIVCRFTLPKYNEFFERDVTGKFGGLTRWGVGGRWNSSNGIVVEAMLMYEVAVNQPEVQVLRSLVCEEAREQGEISLYFMTGTEAEVIWL